MSSSDEIHQRDDDFRDQHRDDDSAKMP